MQDTIVARCTPQGRSPRAMLRLSGPGIADIIERTILGDVPPRRVAAVRLRLDHAHDLPVLIARYAAPASYTAQDSIEIQLPGNPRLIERAIGVLISAGARPAEPGEFSARAYLNGRLTLEEGEGVGAMIAARSASQLRTAHRLLSGQAAGEYAEWTEALANLLALVESGIDFTDQEGIVAISPKDLAARVEELTEPIESRLALSHLSTINTQPLVVLVGEPNAGKSTLFNALLTRPRSITSDEPATTRDAIIEPLDLSACGGPQILLADLPGLDLDPRGEAETQAQASARAAIDRADAIVLCDPAGRFSGVCEDWMRDDRPTLRVRTKADLPGASTAGLGVCALDSWNLDSLRLALAEMAAGLDSAESDLVPRHRRVLSLALSNLIAARSLAQRSDALLSDAELIASELRRALDLLGELSGEVTPDDVIGRVFSSFCVGK